MARYMKTLFPYLGLKRPLRNELQKKYLAACRKSNNIWLLRTCLLLQLHYKDKTNFELLFNLIRENLNSQEFFINKAIGWAVREYTKTEAKAVIHFVKKRSASSDPAVSLEVAEGSENDLITNYLS